LHVGAGALVSGASLAIPPASAVLVLYPFVGSLRHLKWPWAQGIQVWTAPLAGLALTGGLTVAAYGAGALLDRCAPVLLGPTPADRLALAEQRAADLAARNRLARELHDSVGHALSAVTLQAGAARKVLDSDPEFACEALGAIEETARGAVAELDSVLGVLREGHARAGGRAEQAADERIATRRPTLAAGLEGLLNRTRAAGVTLSGGAYSGAEGELARLPDHLSREAYRIVQEGLTNVLRHAGRVPVDLAIAIEQTSDDTVERAVEDGELTVRMENPLPHGSGPPVPASITPADDVRPLGGRGLHGIRERAVLLGGSAEWGPYEGSWRMTVRLPLRNRGAR
jgi:signal transduction histidine kinase